MKTVHRLIGYTDLKSCMSQASNISSLSSSFKGYQKG